MDKVLYALLGGGCVTVCLFVCLFEGVTLEGLLDFRLKKALSAA